MMAYILQTTKLSRDFGELRAVSNVNLRIERGTAVGLVGPNGAGKTTLFNLISGFITPSSGKILLEGEDITDWTVSRRVSAGITRTFQKTRVFPGLTVKENVLTATYSSDNNKMFRVATRDIEEKVVSRMENFPLKSILEATNLEDYMEEPARNLSYGYKQRLELAIALATNPKVLLLDEPFSGTHVGDLQILAEILKVLRDTGLTVILVEHDLASVVNLVDRIVYMKGGRLKIPDE